MDEYKGVIYNRDDNVIYRTTVYAGNPQDARYAVAREYGNLHPRLRMAAILANVSVQKVKFGVF